MQKKYKMDSIYRHLYISFIAIVVLLIVPFSITLFVLNNYGIQYHDLVSKMNKVSRLRPLIETTFSDELFMVVAGKIPPGESTAHSHIDNFEKEFLALQEGKENQLELLVIERTMVTLKNYTAQLFEMATLEKPVSEQEALLDEIRAVASLISNMLDSYIALELEQASISSITMQHNIQNIVIGTVVFLLLSILFSIYRIRATSLAVSTPIESLREFADEIALGHLDARIDSVHILELKPLATSLNTMADQLTKLIQENEQEQINLKKSELRTLQAQINPHFLYNTLDTIVWLNQTKRYEEAVNVTKAMSKFFRISLSQGCDWITLRQEVSHLEGYLIIQKVRYRDILNYEIAIEDALLDHVVLKLILQPLVENAIYHGIKNRRGGGTVRIHGYSVGNNMTFCVEDDGVGMSPERLAEVQSLPLEHTHKDMSRGGFGLYNVNKRLTLYYGLEKGIQIESHAGKTKVWFVIPERKEEFDERFYSG